ncbi:MAG: hypothetical protein NC920_04000, partial [Candidatus Omnitrophica bacterium]|nr:hypothetical protein [Candidatus Omnitrophota bacterium]
PGFNDPVSSREQRALEFLSEADVVIVLLYACRPFDKTDKELIVFITPHIFKEYTSPLSAEPLEREMSIPPNLPKEKAIEATLDKFNQ